MLRVSQALLARTAASVTWFAAGAAKLVFPAAAKIGDASVPSWAVAIIGIVELLLAAAWWIPRLRYFAAIVGLLAVIAFFLAMSSGVLQPEDCGCFGRLQLSRSRHYFALGILAASSSLGILADTRKHSYAIE